MRHFDHLHDHVEFEGALYLFGDSQMLRSRPFGMLLLEIAAGNRIKGVVVDNDQVAADCINYLKKNKLGVVTFLPLNKLKDTTLSSGFKGKQGVHGFALDLISFDPKFKKAFSYVFGNTLVVEDIDTARNISSKVCFYL